MATTIIESAEGRYEIESAEGRYETEDVDFGTVYRWCPQCVVLECSCGEKLTLTSSVTTCQCGADHKTAVQGKLATRRLDDEALHPWRYAADHEAASIPF